MGAPAENERRQILGTLFGGVISAEPEVLLDGKPAWVGVGILGPIEKKAFGIETELISATRDFVALIVDQEQQVLATHVIPPELIQNGSALPDESDRRVTRNRLAREYLVKNQLVAPFIGL